MAASNGATGSRREVPFGLNYDVDFGKSFPNNVVKTSKYTCLTFLPMNLFEQLQKAANIYFLGISLLMWLGSNTSLFVSGIGAWTTAALLVMMMAVSALVAAFDDYRRHQADDKLNSQKACIMRVGKRRQRGGVNKSAVSFQTCTWADIQVGDILVVRNEEELPADMVPLASSGLDGICYVSTANLDGETNLKIKSAVPVMQGRLCGQYSEADGDRPLLNEAIERFAALAGHVRAEAPNRSIHSFNGSLHVGEELEEQDGLSANNLLLRGTQLRNTAWCFGVTTYTGRETRLVQNSREVPMKLANLECAVNQAMIVVLMTQAFLSAVCTILYLIHKEYFKGLWYLRNVAATIVLPEYIGYFFTFFILYSNLMPISLYATMEVCNFFQAYFIKNDIEMYDEEQDCPAVVRSTNLCHELGQVSYVFSDKTGTLTQNVMDLKRLSIAGRIFGTVTEARGFQGAAELEEARRKDPNVAAAIDAFLEVLAVSHTVVKTVDRWGKTRLEAESPDEGALVEGAAFLGWSFQGRTGNMAHVEVSRLGRTEMRDYRVDAVNIFTSTRKRMSVVLTGPGGKRVLLVKGADNVMLARAARVDPQLQLDLDAFAEQGLRTLVLGRRVLDEAEYVAWKTHHFDPAQTAMEGREEALAAAAELLEQRLEILGATAIEDKLQVGVAETIVRIREAGIKLWVLTGDKLETARNIGFSTQVLDSSMEIMVLDLPSQLAMSSPEAAAYMEARLEELKPRAAKADIAALLVTGRALEELTTSDFGQELLTLAECCRVVIACRVSPRQKAEMVALVRHGIEPRPVTLAIGDGANDVPMIQEAQIGVGISGKEGRQAVNAADFAIAQFRYLQRLVLVHGRWDYRRTCKFVLYTFWKNAVLTLLMCYYTLYSGYSGTSLFEDMVWNSFNVVLAMPIVATGIFDRDVNAKQALENPRLYETGRRGLDLNVKKMVETLLSAFVHSIIILIVMVFAWDSLNVVEVGDYYTFGTSVYSWLILAMNYRVAFITTTWNVVVVAVWLGSTLMYIVFIWAYSQQSKMNPFMYGVSNHMTKAPLFWICALAVPALAMVMDIGKYYFINEFLPDELMLILERAKAGKLKEKPSQTLSGIPSAIRNMRLFVDNAVRHFSNGLGGREEDVANSSYSFDYPEGAAALSPHSRHSRHPKATDTSLVDSAPPMKKSTVKQRLGQTWSSSTMREHLRTLSRSISCSLHGSSGRGSSEQLARAEQDDSDSSEEGDMSSDEEDQGRRADQEPRTQRPPETPFAQQALKSKQFVITWKIVLLVSLLVGSMLLMMVATLQVASARLSQLQIQYDGEPVSQPFGLLGSEMRHLPCTLEDANTEGYCDINVTVHEDMSAPIRVLYMITPFYQNYNAYFRSYVWPELSGESAMSLHDQQLRSSVCVEASRVSEDGQEIFPCGLLATSMFNDTFEFPGLMQSKDTHEIAWSTDMERYSNPEGYPDALDDAWNNVSFLYERYPGVIPRGDSRGDGGVVNGRFAGWMRPSGWNRVGKPVGYINSNLTAGETLTIRIRPHYPVSTLEGVSKHIFLMTYTTLGGRNSALINLLSIFGALCYLIASLVAIIRFTCPRRPGEPRFKDQASREKFFGNAMPWSSDDEEEDSDEDDDSDESDSSPDAENGRLRE
eukprot:TRINITY_DN44759_c0_g1_i2.p1 TRINITY_DN44759_c0_g1~~TRINITY_DN44759_c0_g1_i2.p1  ORF type:complete len:1640 (+),score=354.07 TRINITY_DN44759_c0_g1_i2:149-5068(+)